MHKTPKPPASEASTSNKDLEALDQHERAILERQLENAAAKSGYFALYRYADTQDLLFLALCVLCAIAGGVALPLVMVIFGNFANSFAGFFGGGTVSSAFSQTIHTLVLDLIYIGIAALLATYISTLGFNFLGARLTRKLREAYLAAILRQNVAFFDFVGSGEITTRITGNMSLIQDAISEKVALTISGLATFVTALVVSFRASWKLAFVMLSGVIAIILVLGGLGKRLKGAQGKVVEFAAANASIAEESVASIRNVTAYGMQENILAKYDADEDKTAQLDFKAKAGIGYMMACMMLLMNCIYALAFWQGGRFLRSGDLNIGQLLTCLFASVIGGASIGHIAPHIGAFTMGTSVGHKILNTIDRESPIDIVSDDGDTLKECNGTIEFQNVKLIYPSRPSATVLPDFSLTIPAGKMTAIVGPSGSGKSSLVGLIERFYLPVHGNILFDGHDISQLQLRWLRTQVALVSQEPTLFADTVYNNIALGLIGTVHEHASPEKKFAIIEEAARSANAHDFIMALPSGYDTTVGQRGSLLSGGQKQRVAIARAVVSDPKILLLDEATAALDTKSEAAVQAALDEVAQHRTTLVIAHRLSTIKNADNIVVMSDGRIVEQGTHDKLLKLNGVYKSLVDTQNLANSDDDNGLIQDDGEGRDHLAIAKTKSRADSRIMDEEAADIVRNHELSMWQAASFIWSVNKQERMFLIGGMIATIPAGLMYPILSIFMGNSIITLSGGKADGGHGINFWAGLLLMLGFVCLVANATHGYLFAKASAALISRARRMTLRSVFGQDIAFFDMNEHSSGAIASFLSTESARLAGVSGATLGAVISFCFTVGGAVTVAFIYGWRLAVVAGTAMPILILMGFMRLYSLGMLEKRKKRVNDAASFACEAASSIRTIASLGIEEHVCEQYGRKLQKGDKMDIGYTAGSSFLYALSQSVNIFAMALTFWYGGRLMTRRELDIKQFFIIFNCMILGSQAAGVIFSYAPDMANAKDAASKMKALLDTQPVISRRTNTTTKLPPTLNGDIALHNVSFSYPSRPHIRVLKNINIEAHRGEFIALVGPSGSGKSTVISLLERFYDVNGGELLIDEVNVKELDVQDFRRHVALVSQETVLYSGNIRENVLTDQIEVEQHKVEAACQDANIHEFIVSLTDGYNTLVGAHGNLLSGGQRQRIAIARALLRDPEILLLDEATSALDSTSEAVVQAALDRAARGRTTIAIAHRLSTIQHADRIYVLDGGQVVEQGKHIELMSKRGVYFGLVKGQQLESTTT